jgi:regulator of replication initiation timing
LPLGKVPSVSNDLNEVEYDADARFVPDWNLKNGTIVDTPRLCREYMHSARTPAEVNYGDELSEKKLSNASCVYAVNAFHHFIALHERFIDLSNGKKVMQDQLAELRETESRVLSENALLRKNLSDLQGKCSSLEKEVAKNKTQASDFEMAKSRVSELECLVDRLKSERSWLIAEGMPLMFEKVRNSDGY